VNHQIGAPGQATDAERLSLLQVEWCLDSAERQCQASVAGGLLSKNQDRHAKDRATMRSDVLHPFHGITCHFSRLDDTALERDALQLTSEFLNELDRNMARAGKLPAERAIQIAGAPAISEPGQKSNSPGMSSQVKCA
jgi:hypothetical protein